MGSVTISIRVSKEMHNWLGRFAMARTSVGGMAARLLEEARRKEEFPCVEFRDTPLGRVAYVSGTRVQMALAWRLARDRKLDPEALASHYGWPLGMAESAMGYLREYSEELAEDEKNLVHAEESSLRKILPRLESVSV